MLDPSPAHMAPWGLGRLQPQLVTQPAGLLLAVPAGVRAAAAGGTDHVATLLDLVHVAVAAPAAAAAAAGLLLAAMSKAAWRRKTQKSSGHAG